MRKSLLVAACSLLTLAACSDDDTGNPVNPGTGGDTTTYLPMRTGSSWVYSSVETDSTGSIPDEETRTTDSVVVGGTMNVGGKTATAFITYSENGTDTSLYVKDGSTILEWQVVGGTGDAEFDFLPSSSRWVKIADFSATSQWSVFDTSFAGMKVPFDVDGDGAVDTITLSGTMAIRGNKGGTSTVTVNGQNYTATEMTQSITITGNAQATFGGFPVTVPYTISTSSSTWFAPNVGIVKSRSKGMVARFQSQLIQVPPIEISAGMQQDLLRFTIR